MDRKKNRAAVILVTAREMLSDARRWVKGSWKSSRSDDINYYYARCLLQTIEASIAQVDSREEVEGEAMSLCNILTPQPDRQLLLPLLGFVFPNKLVSWNDDRSTTHEAVLARLDNAIAKSFELVEN